MLEMFHQLAISCFVRSLWQMFCFFGGRALISEGCNASEIYHELCKVYGSTVMSEG